jgi:hypothetical protein
LPERPCEPGRVPARPVRPRAPSRRTEPTDFADRPADRK